VCRQDPVRKQPASSCPRLELQCEASGGNGCAGGQQAGHRHPDPIHYTLLFSIPGAFLISGTVASRKGLPRPVPGGEAPLLVLVPPEQQTLVGPALEAGARCCLILSIHPKEVSCTLAHARAGNHPGRHALDLGRAEEDNP
jgi:hypothetical protein